LTTKLFVLVEISEKISPIQYNFLGKSAKIVAFPIELPLYRVSPNIFLISISTDTIK